MHRFESAARLRDGLDVRHAQRGLDQHLDADPVGDAAGRLDLRQQRVHQVHVGRNPDLRHEDAIEAVARLLHDVHHVAVHVMGVDTVDADADGLAAVAPVVLEQGGDDVLAGRLLVGGRDRVLEVEKDVVRLARERLLEQRGLRPRHRQLTPLQPGARRLVAGEAHVLTTVRGVAAPPALGACGAPGDGMLARAGNGAAVPR